MNDTPVWEVFEEIKDRHYWEIVRECNRTGTCVFDLKQKRSTDQISGVEMRAYNAALRKLQFIPHDPELEGRK